MKKWMILLGLLLLSACGNEAVNNEAGDTSDDAMTSSTAVPSASAVSSTAKLPFDMPIMPGARYISGSPEFSRPTKRRGGEAGATIAVKGSPLDIVNYYEKAFIERGFTAELGKINDESVATLNGERPSGEKFLVSAIKGGSKSRPGEATAALVATKPKEP